MAPGEELESERYLITIEERLHPSADHTHGVTSKTQEKEVKDSAGLHYQPGKRKRQVLGLILLKYTHVCACICKVRTVHDVLAWYDYHPLSLFKIPCLDVNWTQCYIMKYMHLYYTYPFEHQSFYNCGKLTLLTKSITVKALWEDTLLSLTRPQSSLLSNSCDSQQRRQEGWLGTSQLLSGSSSTYLDHTCS